MAARNAFAFLGDDFDCALVKESAKERKRHWWARYVTYRNDTTFARVELDDRDRSFNVLFGPLVDGDIPDYPIFLPPSAEGIRWFPLWAVMQAHGAEPPPFSFEDGSLEAELRAWADALRAHGAPALGGDFSEREAVYEVLRANLESRLREDDG